MNDYEINNVSQDTLILRIQQILQDNPSKISMVLQSNGKWSIVYTV